MPIVRHTPVPLSTRGPLYGEEFNAAHMGTNQNGERDAVRRASYTDINNKQIR
ncbi:hypothetical protein PPTG_21128 [Phytophthora nicotianae INRA-310]|uniref:Uncharacterized protein n=1 Tax=Phytophthora nicotianae (strain INRA-310) TaxID=761204 RepID=W2RAM2_PHYN3|nr:hypothetical protein PPTG_21128 [Phytophthora nicotianae INRA-310]ETN21749.1 hypothetical protein PPTG_21128 [Phytophthora nicotianae INRA-310]